MFPTEFQVNCLLVQEKKQKIDFQDGHHSGQLGFPIRMILAIFDLHVTRCYLPSFKSSRLPFGHMDRMTKTIYFI